MQVSKDLLGEMCEIAIEAGGAILEEYNSSSSVYLKKDGSPVTTADLLADRIITRRLEKLFPNVHLLSEESCTSKLPDKCESFFLIDPLDGTKEFIKRNGEFTVNIALIFCNQPIAGVVYAPALDELYFASKDGGAWKHKRGATMRMFCQPWDDRGSLRIIGSRSHACAETKLWLEELTCEHEFVAAGSSLKFCRIADGAADIYPRFAPTSQWDTAAGQCVLEEAGGGVVNMNRESFTYGLDRPIINESFLAVSDQRILSIIPL